MMHECDIILLSYESPDLLKKCVESVLDHTRIDSRLIIVDNASRDPEVRRYLNELSGSGAVKIEKIFSEENAGFAGGMNKGLRLSSAPFVCLLNNDCVVTSGWLEEMINVAHMDDRIGLVNPQSNTFSSRPAEGVSIESHALSLEKRKGTFVELGSAIAFACLIKRAVIEKIGYFDEAYHGVCYEDTDFSERAKTSGFIPVMAEGAYVFHLEQASRKKLKNKETIYRKNRKLFESRWGRLLRVFVFCDSSQDKDKRLQTHEVLKALARKRVIVEAWFNEGDCGVKIRHADVGVKTVPRKAAAVRILWRIFTKKKRYDAVILPEGFLIRFLRLVKPLHGAVPFVLDDNYEAVSGKDAIFNLKEPSLLVEYLHKKRG